MIRVTSGCNMRKQFEILLNGSKYLEVRRRPITPRCFEIDAIINHNTINVHIAYVIVEKAADDDDDVPDNLLNMSAIAKKQQAIQPTRIKYKIISKFDKKNNCK